MGSRIVPNTNEISLSLLQAGMVITTEQDPNSVNVQALTSAPAEAMKHAVNMAFGGKINAQRRPGYIDAFSAPGDAYDDHLIFNGGANLVSDHTWGDSSDDTHGIRAIDRFTYFDNRITRNPFGYEEERFTIFAMRYLSDDAILLTFDSVTVAATAGDIITQAVSGASMVVWGSLVATNVVWGFDLETGAWNAVNAHATTGTLVTVPALDNPNAVANDTSFRTATYHWRNPGVPNIRILETPILDRLIWDSIVAGAFSDANRAGEDPARFWQFVAYGLLGETESFLIGTHGGHFRAPEIAIPPRAWSSTGADLDPPAGSFDSPFIHEAAIQRRCYVWWPDWYRRWATANGYTVPATEANDAGTYNWYAPFIWYLDPYDPDRNLKLTFTVLDYPPPAATDTLTQLTSGASMVVSDVIHSANTILIGFANITVNATVDDIVTQAVSGASMRVETSSTTGEYISGINLNTGVWDTVNAHATTGTLVTAPGLAVPASINSGKMTLHLQSITVAPVAGDTITQAVSGASMVVETVDIAENTITGHNLATGTWGVFANQVTSDDAGGPVFAPSPGTVLSLDFVDDVVFGVDLETGDWELGGAYTVTSDDLVGGPMAPVPAVLAAIEYLNYDRFYAEPCGAFIEEYHDCLFMAKIERTVLDGGGYQTIGTPRRVFNPNEVMYSFPGFGSALQFGTSTVPPQYPFAINNEPYERPWGCASPEGYPLNRIAYAEPRGIGTIVGLVKWNKILYIMKPQGFTAVFGNHPTNFDFENLGMSQGPVGRFAWVKTDLGIFYVTKNGLFLFRGNSADAMTPLSDKKAEKVFDEDIDWGSATEYILGEVMGVSIGWDKQRSEIIISYPKRGEQGGEGQPFSGAPTRQLIYDTTQGRFTEWQYKMPEDNGTEPVGIGIIKSGEDPTDDDYIMFGHPTGNVDGGNDNGRLLFQGNVGNLDADELDNTGTPKLTGNLIPFYTSTPDMTLGTMTPKQAIARHRSLIYATNGVIKQKVTYNYHDVNDESDLRYLGSDEDNFIQTTVQSAKKVLDKGLSREKDFTTVSFTYYNDQETPIPLRMRLSGMTAPPPIGSILTQAVTGATLEVTSVDLANDFVWGTDLYTGTGWDILLGQTVTSNPVGLEPAGLLVPSILSYQNNPLVDNPDTEIMFVAHSAVVTFNDPGVDIA